MVETRSKKRIARAERGAGRRANRTAMAARARAVAVGGWGPSVAARTSPNPLVARARNENQSEGYAVQKHGQINRRCAS